MFVIILIVMGIIMFRCYKVIDRRAVMLLSYGNEIFTHQLSKIIFYTADAA